MHYNERAQKFYNEYQELCKKYEVQVVANLQIVTTNEKEIEEIRKAQEEAMKKMAEGQPQKTGEFANANEAVEAFTQESKAKKEAKSRVVEETTEEKVTEEKVTEEN